jgi:hypothetical protein
MNFSMKRSSMSAHAEIEEIVPLKHGNPIDISLSLSAEQLLDSAETSEDDETLDEDGDEFNTNDELFGGEVEEFDTEDEIEDGFEDGIDEGVYTSLDNIEW